VIALFGAEIQNIIKCGGSEFVILAVSFYKNEELRVDAVSTHQIEWKKVSVIKYWKSESSEVYAVSSIPYTILIDKQRKIVKQNLSLSEIEKLLIEKAMYKWKKLPFWKKKSCNCFLIRIKAIYLQSVWIKKKEISFIN